jgi:hypothetical protein
MPDVQQPHTQQREIHEVVVIPGHQPRTESAAFVATKKRLIADGHDSCWVCGSKENIQTHHFGCEWSLWGDCDPEKLREFLMWADVYGYSNSEEFKGKPILDADDLRNMMQLCETCHIAAQTGIHESTFPIWLSQFMAKPGCNPVPAIVKMALEAKHG